MSFPEHDLYWISTLKFIQEHIHKNEFIFAPEIFWEKFPQIYTYKITKSHKNIPFDCHWAIVHKGLLDDIGVVFLQSIQKELIPVFANEVFIVFTRYANLPTLSKGDIHLETLEQWVKLNHQWFKKLKALGNNWMLKLKIFLSLSPVLDRTTGLTGNMEKIIHFQTLSDEEVRQEMNQIYLEGGYEFPTFYDQIRSGETNQYVLEMLPKTRNKSILDLGCGDRCGASIIDDCEKIVGIDISDVAIEKAKIIHKHRSNCQFFQMNALDLQFSDDSFDIVLSLDLIEHVSNAELHLYEALRVLKKDGIFCFNVANNESLHLRITKALGYPIFKTNYQHIQEFSVSEIQAILNKLGAEVIEIRGSFLLPYWGVPGVDESIRQVVDYQPEIVQVFKDLGHQVAPEYTYSFFITCKKS